MCIYRERNTHLPNCKIQVFHRKDTCVRIKHFDRAFIGKVDFCLISNQRMYISRNTETGIAYLKTAFACFCLIFIFTPDRSVDFRQIILYPSPASSLACPKAAVVSKSVTTVVVILLISVVCYYIRGKSTTVKIHRNDKPATEELQKSYIDITGVTKALQNKNSPQIT